MRNFFVYLIVAIPAGILAGLGLSAYLDNPAIQESPFTKGGFVVVVIVAIILIFKGGKRK